jgi:hypothetical protein
MDATDEKVLEALSEVGGLLAQAKEVEAAFARVFAPIKAELATKAALSSIAADLQEGSVGSLLNAKERAGEVIDDLIKQQLD